MESWICILSIVLVGILFHVLVPTIFFLVFFLAIKRRSNGYHAKTFRSCYFFTISVFLFFVVVLSPAMQRELNVTHVLFILSAIVIWIIGAVNHPNIHWSGEELKASKKAARWVVLMESGVFFVLSYLGADEKIIVMMAAMVLSIVCMAVPAAASENVVDPAGVAAEASIYSPFCATCENKILELGEVCRCFV